MRILQICNRVPYPPADGGAIAMLNLAEALHEVGAQVEILALNTSKHYVAPARIPDFLKEKFKLESFFIDNRLKKWSAFKHLFGKKSYHISRFFHGDFAQIIAKKVKNGNYDTVILEGLSMMIYAKTIRQHSSVKIIYRSHNIEHKIWEELAGGEKHKIKAWYLKSLSKKLKAFELSHLNASDGILAITAEDLKCYRSLNCKAALLYLPLGLNSKNYKISQAPALDQSFFHIGSMDWQPNIRSVEWLINEVWPAVFHQFPGASLHLAGRNMPPHFLALKIPGIFVHGQVAEQQQFINKYKYMLVPVMQASGVRVKIIEGLALQKTIISTTKGAQGITITNPKEILIADGVKQWQQAMRMCLENPQLAQEVAIKGNEFYNKNYTTEAIGTSLINFIKKLEPTPL